MSVNTVSDRLVDEYCSRFKHHARNQSRCLWRSRKPKTGGKCSSTNARKKRDGGDGGDDENNDKVSVGVYINFDNGEGDDECGNDEDDCDGDGVMVMKVVMIIKVLIKVSAAGVNPLDTYIRSGTFAALPPLPYTPGSDAAGIVQVVGSEVNKFKKGDRVFTLRSVSGAYAEYATAEDKFVSHLSEKLSFAQGAAIGVPYYTAAKAIQIRAKAKPGETVLIHGASGAVGIASMQICKAIGLRIIGTAGTREGMDLVKRTGADLVFNHREEGYVKTIQTDIGGIDLILEMLSNVNLQKDLEMLAIKGRVMAEFQEMHSLLSAGQRVGWLDPKVSKVYPLGDVATAHHDVINNQGCLGKLVLDTTK
ncbi:quinone oxidoreductase [Plakobranchus ocellatus]|uniref:Quinone oxidoreductase n=1 Tax=Plakobranchus ocellatus TaxID=259542 RepID=A0AAV3ZM07_9GAST|nr:quinone oxidoreductase [Plakobranchus ocellatus]